jgi:hypothetical protein
MPTDNPLGASNEAVHMPSRHASQEFEKKPAPTIPGVDAEGYTIRPEETKKEETTSYNNDPFFNDDDKTSP